ncbi:MAG: hypothetical protein PHX38_00060 [Sulfuricella sp.]|nr:hypothetical protein [Sulfuricella sp.]
MRSYLLLVASLLVCNAHAGGETFHGRDPETGLESWKASHGGVTLELTQITPDQARAFFIGRGFERADVEHYAAACIFMTVLRNESAPAAISYRLAEWTFLPGRDARPMKLKEDWLKEWAARGMAQAQKIAFEWSQLPSEQTFEPGDWNQGMTTFMLPRGGRFDLKYRWVSQGKPQENTLKGIRCAEENPGS